MADTKKDLRREGLAIRNRMPEEMRKEKSRLIQEKMLRHPACRRADCILSYVNYGTEVETRAFLEDCLAAGKSVFCPLVTGSDMDFYRIFSIEELKAGFHGIPEPPMRPDCLFRLSEWSGRTLMVMPGVVFDRRHRRIGYGGGYYDRYLQDKTGIVTLAAAFSVQVRETVPWDRHDICPRIILTEDGEI